MNKKQRFHLGFLLVVYTMVSLLAAAGAFIGVNKAGHYLIENKVYSRDRILAREKELFSDYIAYLNSHSGNLFSWDDGKMWLDNRQNIMIAVYNGGSPFGTVDTGVLLISASKDAPAMYELLQTQYTDYWYTCPVMMDNDHKRTKLVRVMYYPMYSAREAVLYSSAGIAFSVFVIALMLFIRKKTRYIAYLSRQLNIMESGDLSVPLVLKGSDELTNLAGNMDRMRLSFIERLEHEADMDRSSRELMTAMSHDLRTPLTALMGYLEIMDSGVADAGKNREYIASALKRARQLKGMTDELFEYFLVYTTVDTKPEFETLDAYTVIMQLWDDSSFTLNAEGFNCTSDVRGESCEVMLNTVLMHRVFDNIVSNIRKYADKSFDVTLTLESDETGILATVTNRTGELRKAESSGIGLMSCMKILKAHSGSFTAEATDGVFSTVIRLPKADA